VSARELKATLEEGRRVREQEELEAELEEADVTLVHARDELKQGLMGALSRIAEIFEASDTDGSGMIDANEFCKAVAALGLTASRETCAAVFSHYDVTRLRPRKRRRLGSDGIYGVHAQRAARRARCGGDAGWQPDRPGHERPASDTGRGLG